MTNLTANSRLRHGFQVLFRGSVKNVWLI